MQVDFDFYDESALLYRLSEALTEKPQEVVFLLGSPLSAPLSPDANGVPSVARIIEMIADQFAADPAQKDNFANSLGQDQGLRYQSAFRFLVGRKGQDAANDVVQQAVLQARVSSVASSPLKRRLSDDECRALEADHSGWHLNPGLLSVGQLITAYPGTFGRNLLTTNFDPCIQQSIYLSGGQTYRTTLHGDGNIGQTEATGCHVIHLHGYWWGSDTLHTTKQLTQQRPKLSASLAGLLRNKLLVVCGYGGWQDVFTKTLFEVVQDDSAAPEVLWLFHSQQPSMTDFLQHQLQAGIDRSRVLLYAGIDCNNFFPKLLERWRISSAKPYEPEITKSNPVSINASLQEQVAAIAETHRKIQGEDQDRPPEFSFCIGRESELDQLSTSLANVVFISGIGGQGKSTLAAQYYQNVFNTSSHRVMLWQDCKEEGERLENRLPNIIERLVDGEIPGAELAKQPISSLLDLLVSVISKRSVLFVFDNVDHYVDLDSGRLTSTLDLLVTKLLASPSNSQLVFTCRPNIDYAHADALSIHLSGLSLEAAKKLFSSRNALATPKDVERAHRITEGHSFWLDLLALQSVKRGTPEGLGHLLNEIGVLPENTLTSIWSKLNDREKLVLQVLAETVRPATELELADYLQKHGLNFNRVSKASKSLKAQNLVVVKHLDRVHSVLELHPLVRQFVRTSFPLQERHAFIMAIISVYTKFISRNSSQLEGQPTFDVLQNWTQKAELDTVAGNYGDACSTLRDASRAFTASAFSREYTRTVRLLLSNSNWVADHASWPGFDRMFKAHGEALAYLGENQELDAILEQYAMTVVERNARYIVYCEMRAFAKWVRKDYVLANSWADIGFNLLEKSNRVDVDTSITHVRALAQRDGGRPEEALKVFLEGQTLITLTDPDEIDEERRGAYYGNVGRCLHFMGQTQEALICYQKSAILLEKEEEASDQILNQGYVRWWIGELLLSYGQKRLASVFLEASRRKWKKCAPYLETQIASLQRSLAHSLHEVGQSDDEVEANCLDWILGASVDDPLR